MTPAHYDVVIAGGGPAGAAAALALARKGRRVLLAGRRSRRPIRAGESFPSSATSLLAELGVLERFKNAPHLKSYCSMSVWGSEVPLARDSISDPRGCGYLLDRDDFDEMLAEAARQAGVRTYTQDTISLRRSSGAFHHIELGSATDRVSAHCTWLLDATGRPATLSRQFGARRQRLDRLLAYSASFGSPQNIGQDASIVVEAVPEGWWYSAPLPAGRRLIMFCTDADLADHSRLLSSEGFMAALNQTHEIGRWVERNSQAAITAPTAVDASTTRLDVAKGATWLAIGDSAFSFDPLASRGVASAIHAGINAAVAVDSSLEGHVGAADHFIAHQQAIFDNYLNQLREVYSWERRWSHAEFWFRRHCWNILLPNFQTM